jgi:hypothetical protein
MPCIQSTQRETKDRRASPIECYGIWLGIGPSRFQWRGHRYANARSADETIRLRIRGSGVRISPSAPMKSSTYGTLSRTAFVLGKPWGNFCRRPSISSSPPEKNSRSANFAHRRRAATSEAARLTMSVCSLRQSRSREASDQSSHEGHADSPFGSDHGD